MKMKIAVTFRIDPEMKARLDRACARDRNPYAPSKTRLIERGIELALREVERSMPAARRPSKKD